MHSRQPAYSFVLPAYNECPNLESLAERLVLVGEELGDDFEIVWVNDGSTDGSTDVLNRLAESDDRIRPIHLARNFGHMAALTAGFDAALARDAVICLDSDCQHPPELIPELVARWKQGADIVQAIRLPSPDEGFVKRITSRLFYRVMNVLGDVNLPEGAADFRLLDRQVVEALKSFPERARFIRGLVFWLGFTRDELPYDAPPRMAGHTKYSLIKMMRFALVAVTSFSNRPLRLAFLLGAIVMASAGLYAVYILWCYLTGADLERGWTSTLMVLLILGGVQLFSLGIASEYLARIYTEIKQRPLYVVRKPRPARTRATGTSKHPTSRRLRAFVFRSVPRSVRQDSV